MFSPFPFHSHPIISCRFPSPGQKSSSKFFAHNSKKEENKKQAFQITSVCLCVLCGKSNRPLLLPLFFSLYFFDLLQIYLLLTFDDLLSGKAWPETKKKLCLCFFFCAMLHIRFGDS